MQPKTRPGVVLAIVCIGVVLATTDLFIVNIAFPALERSFGGRSLAALTWVLNAYAIVFAALLVPAGRLADRASRKGGFLLGVAVFTGASALCAAAPSVELLVGARVVQAAGAALMIPCSLGLLLAAYPPERRAGAVRIWAAMSGLAAAIGPVAGGLLVSVDWRWIFLVNLPVGVAALVAGWRLLPSPPPEHEPLPDLLGSLVLMLAVGALTLGLVDAPDWGWGAPGTLAAFGAAAVLIVTFVVRSGRHRSPVLELGLLRVRPFALSTVAMLVFSAGFAAMLLSIVVWAQTGWGWSALKTGLAFAPGPLMVPLFAIGAGRVAHRVGAATLATVGCLVYAAGALTWVATVGLESDYVTSMLPGALLTGIGVGLVLPTLTATAATSLASNRFATGSAVIQMSRQVGYTLGVGILVAVLGAPHTAEERLDAFRRGWIAIAAIALLAAASSLFLVRSSQAPTPRAGACGILTVASRSARSGRAPTRPPRRPGPSEWS
ncbi:MAG TPA: MFS transporter [Gaiellaceae bacterium]|nr:MFS transporter [Gaiellaceae bacterium]